MVYVNMISNKVSIGVLTMISFEESSIRERCYELK